MRAYVNLQETQKTEKIRMTDRDHHIVTSALAVFMRYGIGKTTMNDIAKEAGVSRQTLYNAYAGKDDLLRAVVRVSGHTTLEKVIETWENMNDFREMLDLFFAAVPIKWYEMVEAMPDSIELVEGVHGVAREELEALHDRWVIEIERAMTPYAQALETRGVTLRNFAEHVYFTAVNAKYNARSKEDLLARLDVLRVSTLVMIKAQAQAA